MFNRLVLVWLGGIFGSPDTQTTEEEKEGAGGDDEPDPWVVVLSAFDIVQATIARARLVDEGIPVRVRQESANTAIPVTVGILGRIDVLVPESMQDKALGVLDAEPALDPDEAEDMEDDGQHGHDT